MFYFIFDATILMIHVSVDNEFSSVFAHGIASLVSLSLRELILILRVGRLMSPVSGKLLHNGGTGDIDY